METFKMPVYDTAERQVHPEQKQTRNLLNDYLSENTVRPQFVYVDEYKGKFSVIITLDTVCPDGEVPIDAAVCFSVALKDPIPAAYQVAAPVIRKELVLKWAEYMYDNYLSLIMSKDGADVIRAKVTEFAEYM